MGGSPCPSSNSAPAMASRRGCDVSGSQGLALVHVRAQLEQPRGKFMGNVESYGGQKSSG
jgi:hypothetical protein